MTTPAGPAIRPTAPPAQLVVHQTTMVEDLSNAEFLERYAHAGRVGLSSGTTLVDRVIARAERHLDDEGRWGCWSHAFIFEGQRADGHHWVIESDLQIDPKHIRLGAQENRLSKYHDEQLYTTLAVLDFGLSEAQTAAVLREGLEQVATRARYSLRELLGTYFALHRPDARSRRNVLSRENSFFCSAFVHHLFRQAGIDLLPGLDVKQTTPEDISRASVPHATWLRQREVPTSLVAKMARRVQRRVRARIKRAKRALGSV
jgi:hypothetical protein